MLTSALFAFAAAPLLPQGLPERIVVAVVRPTGGERVAAPASWSRTSIEEWAKGHQLVIQGEAPVYLAFPEQLCGLRHELQLAVGAAQWARTGSQHGILAGDRIPASFRGQVEASLLMSSRTDERPTADVETMDFSIGVNGWFQLGAGEKTVWVVVDHSGPEQGLRPGKAERLKAGEPYQRPSPDWLRIDAFESVTVDVLASQGYSPSVRERVGASAAALEAFHSAVVEASDEIRRAYAEVYASLADKESARIKAALASDALKASDLPSDVARRIRERLVAGFARYGFTSPEQAASFFDRADVRTRRARLALQYRLERGGRAVGQSGEFSGPFTPRG
jgi:hypothetical protein